MLYADVNAAIKTTRDPGGLIGLMVCLVVASFFRALAALIEQVAAGKLLPTPVAEPRVIRPRITPKSAPGPLPVTDLTQLPTPVDDAATRALDRAFAYLMATEPAASNPDHNHSHNHNSVMPGLDPGIGRPLLACVAVAADTNLNRVTSGLDPGIHVPSQLRGLPPAAPPAPSRQHFLTNRPPLSKRRPWPTPICA